MEKFPSLSDRMGCDGTKTATVCCGRFNYIENGQTCSSAGRRNMENAHENTNSPKKKKFQPALVAVRFNFIQWDVRRFVCEGERVHAIKSVESRLRVQTTCRFVAELFIHSWKLHDIALFPFTVTMQQLGFEINFTFLPLAHTHTLMENTRVDCWRCRQWN